MVYVTDFVPGFCPQCGNKLYVNPREYWARNAHTCPVCETHFQFDRDLEDKYYGNEREVESIMCDDDIEVTDDDLKEFDKHGPIRIYKRFKYEEGKERILISIVCTKCGKVLKSNRLQLEG